ncbi:hypothetical protein [uncultured Fibrobacter sp.]|uniref:hypothetical protein n=1 Tax=uncultured Fibrobacter sp. TaxID=261512 RepID=UPI0025D71F53|nr:hypothetical protein [uncultured Fibrobacter sp.]
MWKKWSLIAISIVSCVLGCYEDDGICYDSKRFVSLSIVSTSNIDSVQFFLNNQRICIGNTGIDQKMVICKDKSRETSDAMILMLLSEVDLNNCDRSEEYPMWTGFDCLVNGAFDTVKVDSSKLGVNVFSNGRKTIIETDFVVSGGLQVNVIPEQDTTRWFGYKENPAIPQHEAFENPAKSNRNGCFEGYCVATFPIARKEVCYDK